MSLAKVLAYFCSEGLRGLVRSWRISMVAVLTLSISLFLCGVFLLITQNLSRAVESWREEVRVVVFLDSEAQTEDVVATLQGNLLTRPWVHGVETVDPDLAVRRFEESFPSLSGVVEGWQTSPFPTSLEVIVDAEVVDQSGFEEWLDQLRAQAGVEMVDGDQQWLSELAAFLRLMTGAGLGLGILFLAAAAVTGASILRLVAHLHREEIAIMRLVGATEFFVRGPFYVEGAVQGLAGGAVAVLVLRMLVEAFRRGEGMLWAEMVFATPLAPATASALVLVGGLTGLIGAFVSIRSNSLGSDLLT